MKITMFATMPEIKMFCGESGYSFHDVNLAQIYALYEIAGWRRAMIAEHLGYAVSTVSRKRSDMWEFADLAELLFTDIPIVEEEEEEEIILEPTTLYRRFRDGRPAVAMEFMPECGPNIKNEQAVYFFKFYNPNGLEFNKIGTSAKDVVARLRDEIGDYSKKFDISRVEIHRIVSCGRKPAEGAESALRAELIQQYPTAFRKNDRFFGVDISPDVFDEIIAKYFIQKLKNRIEKSYFFTLFCLAARWRLQRAEFRVLNVQHFYSLKRLLSHGEVLNPESIVLK